MEDNKKILEKIKKLFKLSESSNVNEATLALQKAKELLDKYELTVEEIELSEVREVIGDKLPNLKTPQYTVTLMLSIAELFNCKIYNTTVVYSYSKKTVNPVFIGLSPNVEIASYCFSVLSKKLEYSRKEFVANLNPRTKKANKTKRGDEFALGWAYGVNSSVKKLVPENSIPAVVKTYYDKKATGMEEAKIKSIIVRPSKADSLRKGYAEGEKVDLRKPVNGVKKVAQLV